MAAISIYLLLGAMFVPFYGALELFSPGSFIDTSPQAVELGWQQFVYYSYVTLNTIGYGDILPVTLTAKMSVHARRHGGRFVHRLCDCATCQFI